MIRIFVLALLLLSLVPAALTAMERSETVGTPYDTVLKASAFSIGAVGIAGVPSREEIGFRELLKQKNANEQFRTLVTKATPAGQLFALLGLKLLHDPAYPEAAQRLGSSTEEVTMFAGCVGARASAASIAKKIENGTLK